MTSCSGACPLCLPRPDDSPQWIKVCKLSVSTLYLDRNQTYRGHCQLVYDTGHVVGIENLPASEFSSLMSDLHRAAVAISRVCSPDLMNYVSLGNVVPHLHWHLVPRYRSDPRWGRLIYTSDPSDMPVTKVSESEYSALVQDLIHGCALIPAGILTQRLNLIPMSPAFLRASLAGDTAEAGACIGLHVPEPQSEDRHVLSLRLKQLEENPALQPWLLRAIGLRDTGEMIGHIGFHTSPGPEYLQPWSPDGVELGFTVLPAHRRKGYAREAVLALMQWAKSNHDTKDFVVTVSPQNAASQALVAQLGFVRIGGHVDDVDGPEDILTLSLA